VPSSEDADAKEGGPPADLRSVILDIHKAVADMNRRITDFERRIGSLEEELDESHKELQVLRLAVFKTLPAAEETRTLHREVSREQAGEDEEVEVLTPDMMKKIRRATKG
jgi:predicted  nucleic acid-binding Zn-ribbon protein